MTQMNNQAEDEEFEEPRDDAIIGRAFRYSLIGLAVAAVAVGVPLSYATWSGGGAEVEESRPVALPTYRAPVEPELPSIPWTDITAEAGIDFVHENGAAGEKLLPETMGGGCAFLDYNGGCSFTARSGSAHR